MPGYDSTEDRERVYARIASVIMAFHEVKWGQEFHVEDLRRYVRGQVPGIAPDSPGRILRELRLRGELDYVVVNRRQSLYRFCTGRSEDEGDDLEDY